MSGAPSIRSSRSARIVLIVAVVILLVVAPLVLPAFVNQTLVRIGVYAVAVLGLNIVMGYTGQVNLGQIFFVGLGAYVTAYGVNHGWNIMVVFIAACVIAGIVGQARGARNRDGHHCPADRRRAPRQAAC
jgi:branched-chain amino acid transport system permease protein